MFIGSINSDLRSVIKKIINKISKKTDVYVGCSGNFTIERILNDNEFESIYSNDVSLYTSFIGHYLTGKKLKISVQRESLYWLNDYMEDDISIIATIMLCTQMFDYLDRDTYYHKRMLNGYKNQFDELHKETIEKIKPTLENIKVNDYFAGDVLEFFREAQDDILAVSFPPTYSGGYEKMYKKMEEVFKWEPPEYEEFDENSFTNLMDIMRKKKYWIISRDEKNESLEDNMIARVQTSFSNKPVYVYSNLSDSIITVPHQNVEDLLVSRLNGELSGDINVIKISQPQMNNLRSQYLSKKITPAQSSINLAFLDGNRLIGAVGFSLSRYDWCDIYMMTDFSVRPTLYARLSKLVLNLVLSEEIKEIVEDTFNSRARTIGTTAFTDKPVSMKYRGIFDLHDRKEGRLNYIGKTGQWDLKGGFKIWKKKHSKKYKK